MADIVVITGLSGAGRSASPTCMEDLGWYVVDNLPTSLVEKVVELASLPGAAASTASPSSPGATTASCSNGSPRCAPSATASRCVFLDASPTELVRRYDATRRKHPLADRGRRPARVDRARAGDARAAPATPPTW